MTIRSNALEWLVQESQALLSRLDGVRPFSLVESMVPAAAPPYTVQLNIERFLVQGRKELRQLALENLRWLRGPGSRDVPLSEAQRRFAFLRLRFNAVLDQFDIFADVMTQRSEYETGVWLAGLDVLAADALNLSGSYFSPPAIVCYLDRGHGAAIRRARTRLPGGGENPVAIIRVPRERMVSNGVASSLVHEVGHQGSALLDLVCSLNRPLSRLAGQGNSQGEVWGMFKRWLSEILADFWSVARVSACSTLGLMSVVSLPRFFVFRIGLDDPHPIPWIRVKLSCAIGDALYPHPQWSRFSEMWETYYPLDGLSAAKRRVLGNIETGIPDFVQLLIEHRPPSLDGRSLGEAVASPDRHPDSLRELYQTIGGRTRTMRRLPPTLVFALAGQARADGNLSPEEESRLLRELLTFWSIRGAVIHKSICAAKAEPAAAGAAA